MSEPRIPERGVRTPMRMSEEGVIESEVLPNRMAVDVIVINPDGRGQLGVRERKEGEGTNHPKEETTQPNT